MKLSTVHRHLGADWGLGKNMGALAPNPRRCHPCQIGQQYDVWRRFRLYILHIAVSVDYQFHLSTAAPKLSSITLK